MVCITDLSFGPHLFLSILMTPPLKSDLHILLFPKVFDFFWL